MNWAFILLGFAALAGVVVFCMGALRGGVIGTVLGAVLFFLASSLAGMSHVADMQRVAAFEEPRR